MSTVETIEANGHLSELLDRVAQGETITLTDGGRPVAKLIPAAPEEQPRRDVAQVVKDMLAYRDSQGVTLGDLTVREMIEEGRRY